MVAAELWGLERKREIAIRRAFGFSAMQIQRYLLSEFLKLSVISLAISSVGIGVVGIFTKKQRITSGLSGPGVLTFTAFFVLTAILSVIPVSVRAVRGSSVNQMIQRG
jgi:ABC-type antimicrobial peptide transport system permease subunit